MGVPIQTLQQFENTVRFKNKPWAIIILANPHSDSKAAQLVINNFHEMDSISGPEVDFYLPGYSLNQTIGNLNASSTYFKQDHYYYHNIIANEFPDLHGRKYQKDEGDDYLRVIRSPRLGDIYYSEAEFVDFIMGLARFNRKYSYIGTCQLILLPITNDKARYELMSVYDLDNIINSPGGPSLDAFLHFVIEEVRQVKTRFSSSLFAISLFQANIIKRIDEKYAEATQINDKDNYVIHINNVIVDMEKVINYHLRDNFYFISYSSRNELQAYHLRNMLQNVGFHTWIAPDGIPQGREYSLVIPTALKYANNFVILLTPDSAQSAWVKRELDIAISNEANTKVRVLFANGFTLKDLRKDDELSFMLNRIQIKYTYEDIIINSELFNRFATE